MATNAKSPEARSAGPHTLGKVRPHPSQNEALLFEKSSPGKRAYKLPPLDVPAVDSAKLLGAAHRKDAGLLPELSEIEIIRHFTRLSTWNYAIDLGMYPLGSCTMKYNPRVNEFVARIEGLAEAHPYRPESLVAGNSRNLRSAAALPARHHRHGRDHAAAGRRRARRVHRNPAHARVARVAGQSAQKDSHSRLRARHQPGHSGHRRLRGRESQVECRRRHRSRSSRAAGGRRDRCADAHQPLDARRLREPDSQDRRHSARQGRAALHGRRKHECAGGQGAARRLRRGRDAPEPAQDLLNTARRRRTRLRPGGLQGVS